MFRGTDFPPDPFLSKMSEEKGGQGKSVSPDPFPSKCLKKRGLWGGSPGHVCNYSLSLYVFLRHLFEGETNYSQIDEYIATTQNFSNSPHLLRETRQPHFVLESLGKGGNGVSPRIDFNHSKFFF